MARGQHSSGRPSRTPAIIGVIVVLLIAGAAAAYFIAGSGGGSDDSGDQGPGKPQISTETPDFAFDTRQVTVVVSSPDTKADHESAQPLAADITETMNDYYRAAFLDPNNWRAGTYAPALAFFDKAAVAGAKEQDGVITLGDAYTDAESVEPKPSTNSVKILLNPAGKPAEAVAQVTFGALVTGANGEQTTVSNLGQFFLRPVDAKTWKIYAFRIDRTDEPGDQVVGSPTPAPKKDKATESPAAEETP